MAGCQVLMFTGFDPRFPVLRLIRGKVAAYNMHLRAIADRHRCHLVDLWSMRVLRDPRAWSADRLHLTPDAHHRVALRTCEVLGVAAAADWREPWPAAEGVAGGVAASGGGLAGGPPDGPALGAPPRGAVGGPPGARHLLGRRRRPQAPRTAPAVAAARGVRPGRDGRSSVLSAQPLRSMGQLMHRGPPRPRPSSPPATVITSMPFSSR